MQTQVRALHQNWFDQQLQIVGVINAYCALLAEHAGAKALYLSGAGCANASLGVADDGRLTLDDILIDLQRIRAATELPILVDIDTGWGDLSVLAEAIPLLEQVGASALQIEDQIPAKRCGHLTGKQLVSSDLMQQRIRTIACHRSDPNLLIVARTDAESVEGLDAAIARAQAYVEAGADVIFPEGLVSLEQFKQFTQSITVPVLANITEFGKTPLLDRAVLFEAGIKAILYPLTAFRMMSAAALETYTTILEQGSQAELVDKMQTRQALYDILNYDANGEPPCK